jgi:hypothetical protein
VHNVTKKGAVLYILSERDEYLKALSFSSNTSELDGHVDALEVIRYIKKRDIACTSHLVFTVRLERGLSIPPRI